MAVKSITTRILLNLWLLLSLSFLSIPATSAQVGAISCQDLNSGEATKDWIISIIEEQFEEGATSLEEGTFTMLCARETVCTEGEEEGTGECNSKYVDPTACSPGENTICQTVRVFGSKSGLGLLFTYIGLIYRWVAGVIGVVAVFYIVYAGIKISTAGDNTAAVDEAKTKIIQAIAGLVLLFISAVVLYTINPNFFTL